MKFCDIIRLRSSFTFLFFILFSLSAAAQVATSSPYSRYGVGDLHQGGFAKNLGMGGLSLGLIQPFNVNFSNPASYSSVLLTTFEAGGAASMYEEYTSTSFHSYQYIANIGFVCELGIVEFRIAGKFNSSYLIYGSEDVRSIQQETLLFQRPGLV